MTEPTNGDRSEWAAAAIRAFVARTKTDPEDALADLLCDLMHWADHVEHPQGGTFDFEEEFERAQRMYLEEIQDEGG